MNAKPLNDIYKIIRDSWFVARDSWFVVRENQNGPLAQPLFDKAPLGLCQKSGCAIGNASFFINNHMS